MVGQILLFIFGGILYLFITAVTLIGVYKRSIPYIENIGEMIHTLKPIKPSFIPNNRVLEFFNLKSSKFKTFLLKYFDAIDYFEDYYGFFKVLFFIPKFITFYKIDLSPYEIYLINDFHLFIQIIFLIIRIGIIFLAILLYLIYFIITTLFISMPVAIPFMFIYMLTHNA